MAITKNRALRIVADLLQKYPKGPRGRKGYKKEDYNLRHQYCEDVDAYRSLPQLACGTDYFGYSKKDLLDLSTFKFGEDQDGDFATSEWDWRPAIRSIYPKLRYNSKAVTSRARRLTRRIGSPVSSLVRSGTLAGCYRVQFGYGNDGGSVVAYGNTSEDARAVAELMCGHAFPNEQVRNTQLISILNVGAITNINQAAVKRIEKDIQDKLDRIAKSKEQIEKLEIKQAVIRMFSTQQVGAMATALCEEIA
jgi:hypothetical protein